MANIKVKKGNFGAYIGSWGCKSSIRALVLFAPLCPYKVVKIGLSHNKNAYLPALHFLGTKVGTTFFGVSAKGAA